MPRITLLAATVVVVGAVSPCLSFQPLFDGRTLNDFTQRGGTAKYEVVGGVIVGTSVPNTPNSFLCTKKHFSDFVLEYEFKVDPKLNSGVQVRSNAYDSETTVITSTPSGEKKTIKIAPKRVHGYQIEIDPSDRAWTAGIYDEGRRGWLDDLGDNEPGRKAFRANEWNKVRVEAIGSSIKTWLNGVPAANLTDGMTPSGFVGLQVHGVGASTEKLQIRWRNLRIADLSRTVSPGQLLYMALSNKSKIVAREIHQGPGALSERFTLELPGNPGAMTFSPDRSYLYAVTSLGEGKSGVTTCKRAPDGSLSIVSSDPITTRAPYIRTSKDGRLLLAAHYSAGDVTVYRIVNGICTGELLDQKKTERTAHAIEIDPSGKYVFVPHTGPNKMYQFRLDGTTGKLTPNDPPFVEGPDKDHRYHEPRHYAHHPTLDIGYTSNEKGSGITAWRFNPKNGTLHRLTTMSTLPPGSEGKFHAADIQITPNGRFVYVSTRDHTSREKGDPKQDTLAGVSLDPQTGEMKLVGYFPTPSTPRSFCIDVTGQFVYSGGTQTSTLFAYRINQKTGALEHFSTYEAGGVPMWVMCANVGK